jgi:hypothetical protein
VASFVALEFYKVTGVIGENKLVFECWFYLFLEMELDQITSLVLCFPHLQIMTKGILLFVN